MHGTLVTVGTGDAKLVLLDYLMKTGDLHELGERIFVALWLNENKD